MSKKSLYEESKLGLFSLLKQLAFSGLSLAILLLLTGGNPSFLVLNGFVISCILFVAHSEEKRLTKDKNNE